MRVLIVLIQKFGCCSCANFMYCFVVFSASCLGSIPRQRSECKKRDILFITLELFVGLSKLSSGERYVSAGRDGATKLINRLPRSHHRIIVYLARLGPALLSFSVSPNRKKKSNQDSLGGPAVVGPGPGGVMFGGGARAFKEMFDEAMKGGCVEVRSSCCGILFFQTGECIGAPRPRRLFLSAFCL